MIKAPLPKPIEMPKARPAQVAERAEASSNVKSTKTTKEAKASQKDAKEFASELETKLKDGEAQVKAVEVSPEQALDLPSTLTQPGSGDTSSPKVFDPALTKGVENLISPKTTEAAVPMTDAQVLEIANAEAPAAEMKGKFAEVMLKTPQLNGRSPAIDFAKAEIDPQLLNNEDFVVQKNIANKKAVTNAYGMKPVLVEQQKAMMENGLKETQVVKEANGADSAMNSQQFILGLQTESNNSLQINETQAAPKTFDMNNIKSSQPTEIMNQITDYVVQAKAAKEPTVNMRVNHDELGMIDITVSKAGMNDAIAISIGTHSLDGKNFFQQNSKDLFSHLATAGLNVSDLKVETPTQTAKSDFDFGSQSGRNGQPGSEKQFGSEQNQRRHEQDRRQDLWKLLNKEAA